MRRLGCAFGVLLALLIASPAAAGVSVWTPLSGTAGTHVRDFAFESFPPGLGTKGYLATDTQGVYRTSSGGASWSAFNTGLEDPVAQRTRQLLISGNDVYV